MLTPRRGAVLALAGAVALGVLVAPASQAQVPPLTGSSTTTTTVPPTSTTQGPSGDDLSSGGRTAPKGAVDAKGDGTAAPVGGIKVPPDARAIIDAVPRTPPSDNDGLVARIGDLEAMGLSSADAFRVGFGRFPIAGAAHYSDDWLYPRYGPGFRFHLGTDVFAAYGTPVRAPVEGIARSSTNGLGGLTVKVIMADGTYFYMAHLSGLVEGFTQDRPVKTGDVVGYVGDSGNAKGGAPHLHFGIYPHGGDPIDPKPVLDQFLHEAEGRLPAVMDAYRQARPAHPGAGKTGTAATDPTAARPTLATDLLYPRTAASRAKAIDLLYIAAANPLVGPRTFIELAVDDLAATIDWSAREPAP